MLFKKRKNLHLGDMSLALLEMIHPVATGLLQVRREVLIDGVPLYVFA